MAYILDTDVIIDFLRNKGRKLADFDLLIASSAKLYGFILVTKNIKHFERTGVKIFK